MRYRYLLRFIIPYVLLSISGCGNPDEIVSSSAVQKNYILNSSFEIAGEPSNDGWIFGYAPYVKFAYQAPPSGGNICLLLKALQLGGSIHKTIPLNEGSRVYKFSFWGKINYYPGELILYQKKNDRLFPRRSVSIEDTVWTRYAFADTIDAAAGDSLRIEINGSDLYQVQAYTWIDLIQIEQTE